MALLPTNRRIRRQIVTEHEKLPLGKLPASAQINTLNRRITIPDDDRSPWNGVQVSQYISTAIMNLKGGTEA